MSKHEIGVEEICAGIEGPAAGLFFQRPERRPVIARRRQEQEMDAGFHEVDGAFRQNAAKALGGPPPPLSTRLEPAHACRKPWG